MRDGVRGRARGEGVAVLAWCGPVRFWGVRAAAVAEGDDARINPAGFSVLGSRDDEDEVVLRAPWAVHRNGDRVYPAGIGEESRVQFPGLPRSRLMKKS